MVKSWYGNATLITISGLNVSINAIISSVLSAINCAVVTFVLPPSNFFFKASHLYNVRLAIQSSWNTYGFWQHLCATTPATPPAPIIKAFPIISALLIRYFIVPYHGNYYIKNNGIYQGNRQIFKVFLNIAVKISFFCLCFILWNDFFHICGYFWIF